MKTINKKLLDAIENIIDTKWKWSLDYAVIKNSIALDVIELFDQQTKELMDEISMKTKYYEDKLEHQHIALSEHYKEIVLLKDEIEKLKEDNVKYEFMISQSKFRR